METALSTLRNLPQNKAEIENFSAQIIDAILAGNDDPLEIDIILKSLETVIEKVRKHETVKEYVHEAATRYIGEGKTFTLKNVDVTVSSRKTYDYSTDSQYSDLKLQEKGLKAAMKAREGIIKSGIDVDTGEVIPTPPFKEIQVLTYKFK